MLTLSLGGLMAAGAAGCAGTRGFGPQTPGYPTLFGAVAEGYRLPEWPAVERERAKTLFRYYREAQVYLNTGAGLFVWREGAGWRSGHRLPRELGILEPDSGYVLVELGSEDPARYHEQIVAAHPPRSRQVARVE